MTDAADAPALVLVPADLLTAACVLIGKLPAEHAARVYLALRECEQADATATPNGSTSERGSAPTPPLRS